MSNYLAMLPWTSLLQASPQTFFVACQELAVGIANHLQATADVPFKKLRHLSISVLMGFHATSHLLYFQGGTRIAK